MSVEQAESLFQLSQEIGGIAIGWKPAHWHSTTPGTVSSV
jgi:hypothetical protein